MKVLELCMSIGVGGLELYAVRTAEELCARKIECIAVAAKKTMTADRMKDSGITTCYLPSASKILPLLAARKLARIIDEHEIDVVHMHWGRDLSLAVLAKLRAKRDIKLVYTRQMMLTRSKHGFYHRFLYRHVDLFITITRELEVLARRFLPMPDEAIKTLYYGVAKPPQLSDKQLQELRQSFGVPEGSLSVALVGRIEEGKGQHLLVDALEQLIMQGQNVHGTIIGPVMDQKYFDRLKRIVKDQGMAGNVSFYGSHNSPIDIMAAFDAVVLASRQETFGLVLIEAMRNGVAVIGTNSGGVPEIIENGKSGFLFKPGDSSELATILSRLNKEAGLRDMVAKCGKERADALFSKERHYEQLQKLFFTLLNNSSAV